jgi:hypothetical protein
MNDEQLLCIMAAIIFAGADDNQQSSGYTAGQAVGHAARILGTIRNKEQAIISMAMHENTE